MVEQRSPKPTVEGSSPSAPAIKAPFLGFFSFWLYQKSSVTALAMTTVFLSARLGHIKVVFSLTRLLSYSCLAPSSWYCLSKTARLFLNRPYKPYS